MAKDLERNDFWLPAEFLTEEELLNDFKNNGFELKKSNFSSPVESIFGSNETESDEDEINLKMAYSSLNDLPYPKEPNLSSSPQSTLHESKDSVGSDFLHAAAEDAIRQRLEKLVDDDKWSYYISLVNGPKTPKPGPDTFYQVQAYALYAQQRLRDQLLRQYQQLQQQKQQKLQNQQQQQLQQQLQKQNQQQQQLQQPRNVGGTSVWPTLQQSQQMQAPRQRPGPVMRPVFGGETGVRKERTGTGVFLPRSFENVQQKPACSVHLPEKVVHALNLNLDSSSQTKNYRNVVAAAANSGVGFQHQNNGKFGQQMQSSWAPPPQQQQQQQQVVKQELGLPQEWTY